MFQTIFSRTDFFLLFIFFFTFLASLIMTIGKCIKKAIITIALATILLVLFLEEYYSKQKISSKNFNSETFSKIANEQPPHQSPTTTFKKIKQHQQIPKIPDHQHVFVSKTIHIPLKKDTHDYLNH